MSNDTPARKVIGKFGGVGGLSRALGHKNPTTVRGWFERGFIPARQQQAVLITGRKMGLDVSPADFFDLSSNNESTDAEMPDRCNGRALFDAPRL